IVTTKAKAKALKMYIEPLVTKARRGNEMPAPTLVYHLPDRCVCE
ncbi:MAG: 50S ribosomal protein L17, partial [Thiotrichales bacterium]